jgi:hypothetical protein
MNEKLRSNIKAIELAKEVNALDLELYEFGINEIFPKLCENAGVTPWRRFSSRHLPSTNFNGNMSLAGGIINSSDNFVSCELRYMPSHSRASTQELSDQPPVTNVPTRPGPSRSK